MWVKDLNVMIIEQIAGFLKNNSWIMNLVFILFGSYYIASTVNTVIGHNLRALPTSNSNQNGNKFSTTNKPKKNEKLSNIATRNLFGAKREVLKPQETEITPEENSFVGNEYGEEELQSCSVPISLRATLVSSKKPEWSIAVIYNNSKRETEVYSVIDGKNQILDDATLVEVRSREIIVRRNDHFERCLAEGEDDKNKGSGRNNKKPKFSNSSSKKQQSKSSESDDKVGSGVTKVSDTEYHVEREEIDRVLGNLSSVATKARIVPSFKNGKPNGFKLFSIKPKSIFSKIGLKNGDVVQKINGYDMNSPDKALELYSKLKDSSNITVDVKRRGRSMTLNYAVGR